MTYKQAFGWAITKITIGIIISSAGLISTIISILHAFYYQFENSNILNVFSMLIVKIYENTRFLEIFWKHSPLINLNPLFSLNNLYPLLIYCSIIMGMFFYQSGNNMFIRLKAIRQNNEYRIIYQSTDSNMGQITYGVDTEKKDSFNLFHSLYIAPLVVGIILAIIQKFI